MTKAPLNTSVGVQQHPNYKDELRVVRGLRDALDRPVDRKIETTVVALRLLGFVTTSSCGGHSGRATTGPYVMFRSTEADAIIKSATAEYEADVLTEDFRRARIISLKESARLAQIVEAFWRTRTAFEPNQHLEVRPVGYQDFRLSFVHADFSPLLSSRSLAAITKDRQAEMASFTLHLEKLLRGGDLIVDAPNQEV